MEREWHEHYILILQINIEVIYPIYYYIVNIVTIGYSYLLFIKLDIHVCS